MKFNKDLCHTQNSNATKTEWELLKRRGEKNQKTKEKQLIECYIGEAEMIQLIFEVTEFSNVDFGSGRLEVTEKQEFNFLFAVFLIFKIKRT